MAGPIPTIILSAPFEISQSTSYFTPQENNVVGVSRKIFFRPHPTGSIKKGRIKELKLKPEKIEQITEMMAEMKIKAPKKEPIIDNEANFKIFFELLLKKKAHQKI